MNTILPRPRTLWRAPGFRPLARAMSRDCPGLSMDVVAPQPLDIPRSRYPLLSDHRPRHAVARLAEACSAGARYRDVGVGVPSASSVRPSPPPAGPRRGERLPDHPVSSRYDVRAFRREAFVRRISLVTAGLLLGVILTAGFPSSASDDRPSRPDAPSWDRIEKMFRTMEGYLARDEAREVSDR